MIDWRSQYKQHAAEVNMSLPTVPTVFMYAGEPWLASYLTCSTRKPSLSLGDPWPAPTILPRLTQEDDCGDYESELAVVIGKPAKNVSEEEALDYVLGYTACNDISSRTSQFAQTQWSFSKGFDGACPIGKPNSLWGEMLCIADHHSPRSNISITKPDPRPVQTPYSRTEEWQSPAELWYRVR
jgi:2-keto-4-pentenoate hydratase/2-oxohepta-3-ene-1,7-dioic acid hydratase in catechol pathway